MTLLVNKETVTTVEKRVYSIQQLCEQQDEYYQN